MKKNREQKFNPLLESRLVLQSKEKRLLVRQLRKMQSCFPQIILFIESLGVEEGSAFKHPMTFQYNTLMAEKNRQKMPEAILRSTLQGQSESMPLTEQVVQQLSNKMLTMEQLAKMKYYEERTPTEVSNTKTIKTYGTDYSVKVFR